MSAATTTASQSHSAVTVYNATRRAESATSGVVVVHCAKATMAMTRNTPIGARRLKISGSVSAATNQRSGWETLENENQPEETTNSPRANVASTTMANRWSQARNLSQNCQAPSRGRGVSSATGVDFGPAHPGFEPSTVWYIGSSLTSRTDRDRTSTAQGWSFGQGAVEHASPA